MRVSKPSVNLGTVSIKVDTVAVVFETIFNGLDGKGGEVSLGAAFLHCPSEPVFVILEHFLGKGIHGKVVKLVRSCLLAIGAFPTAI